MAVEKGVAPFAFVASGDLSDKQFYLVNQASDGQVQLASTKGVFCLGSLQNDPSAEGESANVQTKAGTVTKVVASATAGAGKTISVGTPLINSSQGKAVKAGGSATFYTIGRAQEVLSSGAAAVRIISMQLTHEGQMSSV